MRQIKPVGTPGAFPVRASKLKPVRRAGMVTVTPLRGFTPAEHTAVMEEGQSLASFLSDNDSDRVRVKSVGADGFEPPTSAL